MAANKQTMAAFMASFFGNSGKAISEKLTTDEHNQFTSEVQELETKVTSLESDKTALTDQVTSLTTERDTLASEKATLTTEKANLETDKTNLQASLTTAEGDRDKYKAWFEKQAGAGAQLPDIDATNNNGGELTSYNQQALEVFRKTKNS